MATVSQLTQMLLSIDAGVDLTVLGTMNPFLEHATSIVSAVLPLLIGTEQSSFLVSVALYREALLCLSALLSRVPLQSLGISQEYMRSIIARATDIAVSGESCFISL